MLPLLRNQIEVFLAPKRIDWVQSLRGFKPVKQPVMTVPVSQSTEQQTAWEQALNKLETELPDNANADITVTLSNHWVRYVTLSPQTEINTPEEVYAYADFRMREIYGTRVDNWVISISMWNPASGAICAAIPHELLARTEAIVKNHGNRLNRIEPYFTAVLDKWEKTFQAQKSFVALVETDRLCIGVLKDGIWQNIRNQHILNNVADELWAVLDQEAVLTGQKETVETVYLLAPEHPDLVLPPDCGWQISPMQTEKSAIPEHYPRPFTDDVQENACLA
ncbi:MAG: hypothetical protein KDF59_04890 [Nitrosomonas sp.]|nr:hypothetical protein [Nitrosomonas sp.]